MHSSSAHGNYRPDIDGLRAIAIVPVLFFHAGVPGFRGGYVGVDIFFVISGFLITQLLARDLAENRFSLANFYARRIRRIAPALTAVLLFVAIASAFVLLPFDLAQNSRALVSAVTFTANFELWRQSGYFAPEAQYKPLLHTWSLSIEEQFYLLYPLFLAGIFRLSGSRPVPVLISLALSSFALCVWLTLTHPTSAFYFTFARAWELLLGCILAVLPQRRELPRWFYEILSLAGVGAVAWSMVSFTGQIGIGYALLLPAAGAALVLYANSSGTTWVKQALSSRPVVFTGLISYSLYLWHWPLLAFARVWVLHPLALPNTLLVLALSFVLAAVSWKWIEQPFRKRDGVIPGRKLFAAAGAVAALLVFIGAAGYASQGLPQRFAPEVATVSNFEDYNRSSAQEESKSAAFLCHVAPLQSLDDLPFSCFTAEQGRKNVLLIGDSHAYHIADALREKFEQHGAHLLQVSMSACPPLVGLVGPNHPYCRRFVEFAMSRSRVALDAVVLSAAWGAYDQDLISAKMELVSSLAKTVELFRVQKIPVILIGPSPQYTTSFSEIMARYLASGESPQFAPHTFLDPETFAIDRKFKEWFGDLPGVTYLSLTDLLCLQQRCLSVAPGDVPLIWDEGHFTRAGAELVIERALPMLLKSLDLRNEAS